MPKKNKKTPIKKAGGSNPLDSTNPTYKIFLSATSKTALLLEDPNARIYKSICLTCAKVIKPEEWITKQEMITKNEDHKKLPGNSEHNTDYKIKHTKNLFFK